MVELIKFKLAHLPKVGLRYWWLHAPQLPCVVTVVSEVVTAKKKAFTVTLDTLLANGEVFCLEQEWPLVQFAAMRKARSIVDYTEPITEDTAKRGHRPCPSCKGSRWEATRLYSPRGCVDDFQDYPLINHAVPCIWCSFTGQVPKDSV